MLPDVKINNFNCCAVAAFISYNYNLQNVRREKYLKKEDPYNTEHFVTRTPVKQYEVSRIGFVLI